MGRRQRRCQRTDEESKQVSVDTVPCSSSVSSDRFNANISVKLDKPRDDRLESQGDDDSIMSRASDQRRIRELELELELLRAREEIARLKITQPDVRAFENKIDDHEGGIAVSKREQESSIHAPAYTASIGTKSQAGFYVEKATNNPGFVQHSLAHELPRVELACFDGTATDYWSFIKQFEYYVEAKSSDPGQRMLQLLHYCKGEAREAIKECVMLPPQMAYPRARQILSDLFGQPYKVARSMIDGLLLEARKLPSSDGALSHLAMRMQNCGIALSQMNYEADLNSLAVLEGIVRGLPTHIQSKWAEEADKISFEGREPNFTELTDFVTRCSRVARGRFGQLVGDSYASQNRPRVIETRRMNDHKSFRHSTSPMMIKAMEDPSVICAVCKHNHPLNECQQFSRLDSRDKWATAKKLGLCFHCLSGSHIAPKCRVRSSCGVDGCARPHHPLLHFTVNGETNAKQVETSQVCALRTPGKSIARLGVLPVLVETPQGRVKTMAFLDSGSDATLIKRSFTDRCGLGGEPFRLTISSLGGDKSVESAKVSLKLASIDTDEAIEVDEAFVVDDLPIKPASSIQDEAQKWPHLRDIDFVDLEEKEVTMLIGCDVPEAHWVMEQRVSGRKSPYAVRTLLGWVLCGPLGEARNHATVHYLNVNESLMEKLKAMYDHEFGDTADISETYSLHDKEAIALVERETHIEGGHFVVPLPWKGDKVLMPNNRQIAEKRLVCLRRRFMHDEDLFRRYANIIQDHINKGFIERVPELSTNTVALRQWYLPHHPVVNPRKPEKLRVVFDCAAKFMGRSLNDYLLQGPNLTANLIDVLLRFRLERIAIAADIEEMFLQVKVPKRDRDALRLLWWPENNLDSDATDYRLTVHPFGAVSSPFCANYALRRTLEGCKPSNCASTGSALVSRFYVDDYLASFGDVLTARRQISSLVASLKDRGFRLTKWISNSREVILSIPPQERAAQLREISTGHLPMEKALGLMWDADSDEFVIKLELPNKPMTRRGILATISSMYDPMGFIAPWLLPGKLLLQELCRKRLGWDEPLSPGEQDPWNNWLKTVRQLGEVRIPRCVKDCENEREVELHIFSDASEIGYGAVAYVCFVNEAQNRFTSLVFAKARVAPLKAVSIPRLELAAAVLAVRVSKLIERGWQKGFNRINFWTDSAIVLYYINNNSSRFHTFVANRISEIHDHTRPKQWRHVRSEDNPADRVSRGLLDVSRVQHWLDGPAFLRDSPARWPKCLIPEEVEGAEEKKAAIHLSSVHNDNTFLCRFGKYPTWTSLLNALAWLTRYKTYWMVMHRPSRGSSVRVGRIRLDEIRTAEKDLIVLVQKETLNSGAIIAGDTENTNLRTSRIGKLRPLLINSLLCVGGRLTNSLLTAESRHPIILPKNHFVTELLIRHYHTIEGHAGVNHVLTAIRQRFWILHGAETVKRMIRRCPLCRRQNAVGMKQLMAPLPAVRVREGWHPFSQVGLDYFGPIEVKRGRSSEKRYGCIITCLQSRAVHLDIAHSMSTDSFIMLLMRFVGRRGPPTDLYSDNGSNFTYANKELKVWLSNIDQHKIDAKLVARGIQWHFNPPYASHRGGVWERLIRSVRRILTAVCTEQVLDDERLSSVIVEAERIMNNRPIAPVVCGDPEAAALTPNHLLLLRDNKGLQLKETTLERYKARWKQANHLASVFWRRWSREYLSTMQARQKWMATGRNLREGDVVLVITEALPRGKWPVGVVDKCFPDSDGLVRTVEVNTRNGLIKRDVRQLCFLEGEGNDC